MKSVSPRLGRDRGLWSRQPRWEAWRLPRYDDPSQRGQAAIIVVNDPLRVWFGRKTIATVDAGRAAAGAAVVTDSFLWRRRHPRTQGEQCGTPQQVPHRSMERPVPSPVSPDHHLTVSTHTTA